MLTSKCSECSPDIITYFSPSFSAADSAEAKLMPVALAVKHDDHKLVSSNKALTRGSSSLPLLPKGF